MRLGILSVVPSPYQRDLFWALSEHRDIDLSVAYLEAAAPDSPWPQPALADHESVLPGRTFGKGRVRCHTNRHLPDPNEYDAYIVNTSLTALTTQRMLRRLKNHRNWHFWGEVLRRNHGLKSLVQSGLSRPLRNARSIVAIGSRARSDYAERFPSTPVEQLPYYCDLSGFRPRTRARDVPVFLFCGQMIKRKGVDLLARAFRNLRLGGIEARLVLAGRETELTDGAHPDIEVVGFQSPDNLPELFARADAFVLPSRHDGWGVVINQAIGAGLPIISTTAVGAAIDLIDDGNNGLLIPPGELAPLQAAMKYLADNPSKRAQMAQASAAKAAGLDPRSGAERWFDILTCASS